MPDPTTNAQRARAFMEYLSQGDAANVEILERLLNLAEDRGAAQPLPVDDNTKAALRDTIAETLGDRQGEYAATTRALVDAILEGVDVRLKDEPEPTDPLRETGR